MGAKPKSTKDLKAPQRNKKTQESASLKKKCRIPNRKVGSIWYVNCMQQKDAPGNCIPGIPLKNLSKKRNIFFSLVF
jgi:hypothetical protein